MSTTCCGDLDDLVLFGFEVQPTEIKANKEQKIDVLTSLDDISGILIILKLLHLLQQNLAYETMCFKYLIV